MRSLKLNIENAWANEESFMINLRLVLLLVLVGWNITSAACTKMQVIPSAPKPGDVITLACDTNVAVKQIAVEITGGAWNASLPALYDDASHGDKLSNDKTYSLTLTAPAIAGTYQVKFLRILPDQTEGEFGPITFTVQ